MKIVGTARIKRFVLAHPGAGKPLARWRALLESADLRGWNALQELFPNADYSKPDTIFNIGGNKFRLVCGIDYQQQTIRITTIMTHAEYDRWNKRRRK